jgi:hypothetical protein
MGNMETQLPPFQPSAVDVGDRFHHLVILPSRKTLPAPVGQDAVYEDKNTCSCWKTNPSSATDWYSIDYCVGERPTDSAAWTPFQARAL